MDNLYIFLDAPILKLWSIDQEYFCYSICFYKTSLDIANYNVHLTVLLVVLIIHFNHETLIKMWKYTCTKKNLISANKQWSIMHLYIWA